MENQELLNAIEAKQNELKELVAAKADATVIEGVEGGLKELKEAVKAQGLTLTQLKAQKAAEAPKTFADSVKEAWSENADKIKGVKDNTVKGTGELELKTTVTDASVQNSTVHADIPGIGKQPVRRIFLESLFPAGSVGPDSGGRLRYWDQDTLTRNADNVAEDGLIPESAINWIEQSCEIEKIADSIPVTNESLEDYSFIASEVNNFLLENVQLKVDQQILLGSGVTPQLKGIDGTAQTWAAGSFALEIPTPSIVDVIMTGKTQIENSGQNNMFMPNVVLMNPTDYRKMKLEKDADGNYLIPNYLTADSTTIEGMRVIESPLVTENTLYIMDTTKGTVYNHRNLSLDVANQHGEDFLYDRIRLRATVRKSFVIRNVWANAFLKVNDISAAITDLTKP